MKLKWISLGVLALSTVGGAQTLLTPDWSTTIATTNGQIAIGGTKVWFTQYGPGAGPAYVQALYSFTASSTLPTISTYNFFPFNGNAQVATGVTADSSGNGYILLALQGGNSGPGFKVAELSATGTLLGSNVVYGPAPAYEAVDSSGNLYVVTTAVGTSATVYKFAPGLGSYTTSTITITGALNATVTGITTMGNQPYVSGWSGFPSSSGGYSLGWVYSPGFTSNFYMPGLLTLGTATASYQRYFAIGSDGTYVYPGGFASFPVPNPSQPSDPMWVSYANNTTSSAAYVLEQLSYVDHHVNVPEYYANATQVAFYGNNTLIGGYFQTNNGTTGGMIVGRYLSPAGLGKPYSVLLSNGFGLTGGWPSGCVGIAANATNIWAMGLSGGNALFKMTNPTTGSIGLVGYGNPLTNQAPDGTYSYRGMVLSSGGEAFVLSDGHVYAYH